MGDKPTGGFQARDEDQLRLEKSYSLEQLLSHKLFEDLSVENTRIFLLSLIHHLEELWKDTEKRSQLTQLLIRCLQSTNIPGCLEASERQKFVSALSSELTVKQFLSFAVPMERKLGGNLSEQKYLISTQDKILQKDETVKSPLFIIADNLRSAFNVGSIFRTVECLGAEHIFLCGYTAGPEKIKTKKSAMGTEELVSWSWHSKASLVIKKLQDQKIPCIALETASPRSSMFDFNFTKKCALVLGNERYGLAPELLSLCDETVHIPVYGQKNSLNVGVALAVAAYEYKRQHQS